MQFKKIAEAFENLEVSFNVCAESAVELCNHLKATDKTAIAMVGRIAEAFRQTIIEANKTGAIVKAEIDEGMAAVRELQKVVDGLGKKIEGGDSWRGEG